MKRSSFLKRISICITTLHSLLPISISHRFSGQHDIEVSGFLTATIAWGRRDLILRSAQIIMELMENTSYDFLMSAGPSELKRLRKYVHRTFNGTDCIYFIRGLKHVYDSFESMEDAVIEGMSRTGSLRDGISFLLCHFFGPDHPGGQKSINKI